LRIDKLLFFLRLAKSRSLALSWAEAGHIRLNGRRIEKGSAAVRVGDVITMPLGEAVLTLKLLSVPVRRGPASEAQLFYQRID
jgi:ribosome-associated heat shock protein Hsp15